MKWSETNAEQRQWQFHDKNGYFTQIKNYFFKIDALFSYFNSAADWNR